MFFIIIITFLNNNNNYIFIYQLYFCFVSEKKILFYSVYINTKQFSMNKRMLFVTKKTQLTMLFFLIMYFKRRINYNNLLIKIKTLKSNINSLSFAVYKYCLLNFILQKYFYTVRTFYTKYILIKVYNYTFIKSYFISTFIH